MITNYHRPDTLEQALELISTPGTVPLGGGSLLSQASDQDFAVVDIQALGLDKINKSGNQLEIGASATLNEVLESPFIPPALATALRLEATFNLRNTASTAGALVTCEGRSPFATSMLALDTMLVIAQEKEPISLGHFYPLRRKMYDQYFFLPGKLIIQVVIPLNVTLCFEYVARTPGDRPIVCIAVARWPSGRTRVALGGWGQIPVLAMDGNDPSGVEEAAKNAFSEAADQWASAEYRSEMAGVLSHRCMQTETQ